MYVPVERNYFIISDISQARGDLGTKTITNIYCVIVAFMVRFAESVSSSLQTFRDTVSVPSSGGKEV